MRALLHFFFYLLYHPFAFSYDLVAAAGSLGRWKDWGLSVLPFIQGNRVLEIGHGPGHLQRALRSRNMLAVGIDESAPMVRLARQNLTRKPRSYSRDPNPAQAASIDYTQINLARCLAQQLPFADGCFDTLVATFQADYIFESVTLREAERVLGAAYKPIQKSLFPRLFQFR